VLSLSLTDLLQRVLERDGGALTRCGINVEGLARSFLGVRPVFEKVSMDELDLSSAGRSADRYPPAVVKTGPNLGTETPPTTL